MTAKMQPSSFSRKRIIPSERGNPAERVKSVRILQILIQDEAENKGSLPRGVE